MGKVMKPAEHAPVHGTKHDVRDLAYFGGAPLVTSPMHVGRPNLVNVDLAAERIADVLRSGWLTNDGPQLRRFEAEVAEFLGVEHCVATSSGTVALQLAVKALGVQGEVIMPSFTFPATAHAVSWVGATPVFADVDPITWTLDPRQVRARITSETSCILGVHLFGQPCDVAGLECVAREYRLPLMFDACHAFGCATPTGTVGSFGDLEVFSFHATKFVHTCEGGAITTRDGQLAQQLRALRNFGFDANGNNETVGVNGKMSEVSACLGRTNLATIDVIVQRNRRNFAAYREVFHGVPGVRLRMTDAVRSNYQYVVAEIDHSECGLTRDQLFCLLQAERIFVRRYFIPGCHRLPMYSRASSKGLPVTDQALAKVLVLPTGLATTSRLIDTIGTFLRFCQRNHTEVNRLWTTHRGDSWSGPATDVPRRFESGSPMGTNHLTDAMATTL